MATILTTDTGRKYRLNLQETYAFEDMYFDCQLNDKGQTLWEECIERLIKVSEDIGQKVSKSEAEELLEEYRDDFEDIYYCWGDDDYAKVILENGNLTQLLFKKTQSVHGLAVFFIIHKNKHIYHVTDLSKKGEKS